MIIRCYYCCLEVTSFQEIVQHLVERHKHKEMKFKKCIKGHHRTFNYKVIPDLAHEQGRVITVDNNTEKIHLSKMNVIEKDSPYKKVVKYNTNESASGNDVEELQLGDLEEETEDPIYTELISLLPGAIKTLKASGEIEEYVAFNKLISEEKFPLDNIAFILFMDVVRWFSLDQSTSFMRYSDEVKLFWRTGRRLFHGRFLKFMSGPKHTGQISANQTSRGKFDPFTSKINFAVPSTSVLKEGDVILDDKRPGILEKMIQNVALKDPEQISTYKICVDGKKINPCSKGEVDLWGYGDKPTCQDKQLRLSQEMDHFCNMQSTYEKKMNHGHTTTSTFSEIDVINVSEQIRKSVTILSNHIKDLRQLKLKKEIFLRKMMDKCESDWRNSQYSMVISSLKTTIYQIDNCIENLLTCNDKMMTHVAVINEVGHVINRNKRVNMAFQINAVCLGENSEQENDTALIKQRSPVWFEKRKQCVVTGSTVNRAIGLDGLKSQKRFLEEKMGLKSPEIVSDELQEKFDYGTENESNAIATFVSSYLPAFHPEKSVYEEGCYVLNENEKAVLVVSPDGSVRLSNDDSRLHYGIEVKCPFPGKQFTTSIHYTLPNYYVTQILSEMVALKVDKLYFLSYSKESMAIHEATFDRDLWNDIYKEIIQISNADKIPKKLNSENANIKKRIADYCRSNVTFVAEIKSKVSIDCKHSSNTSGRIFHSFETQSDDGNDERLLQKLQTSVIRCKDAIQESHNICIVKASEVLVFLLGDLDRLYKPELPHAFPIAFAYKGYSMKSEVMRSMIKDVLKVLYQKGLYTPVVSYDGQWSKLAFQTEQGEPLTILELQRKVYNDTKARQKCELLKCIFETGVVKKRNDNEAIVHDVKCDIDCSGAIFLSHATNVRPYTTSSQIAKLLVQATQGNSHKRDQQEKVTDDDSNNLDQVLSNVPGSLIATLDDEVVTTMSSVNNSDVPCDQISVIENANLQTIFEETTVTSDSVTEMEETFTPLADNNDEIESAMETDNDRYINNSYILQLLHALQENKQAAAKWNTVQCSELHNILSHPEQTDRRMTKVDIICCLETLANIKSDLTIYFCKSWNKKTLVEMLNTTMVASYSTIPVFEKTKKSKVRKSPESLLNTCKKKIRSFPKHILNAVVAEHEFDDKLQIWQSDSPFHSETTIDESESIVWFSKPEFNEDTMSYIFSYLDMHHLITNCRVKVCKDGFVERGIYKRAWMDVARDNSTNLRVPHVEDLIDKQSDAIARETFSKDVELCMKRKGYNKEAEFCSIIRQFYEAEDEPGLSAKERCRRRMVLRRWLLQGVHFNKFPPYGVYIRGIPHVMFQGLLTNIDRRIQLFPYVKSGKYNVRSLGSLEAENFFGEFQDLDPKGSGVIKTDEVPAALENACQLLKTRLKPDRPFHMNLSRAKVYPLNDLLVKSETDLQQPYMYPELVSNIVIRSHTFDEPERAKRKSQRRLISIAGPDCAARGVAPVRQFHRCDESKILPHKRLGIELD